MPYIYHISMIDIINTCVMYSIHIINISLSLLFFIYSH